MCALDRKKISIKHKALYFFSLFTTLPLNKYVIWLGKRFYVDGRLAALLLPSYLVEIKRLIEETKHTKNSPFILDVGANIGQFSICMLYFKPASVIIPIEPNKTITPLLRKNLSSFYEQWKLIEIALGPTKKISEFYFVVGKSAQGSMIKSNADYKLLKKNYVNKIDVIEGPITNKIITDETNLSIDTFSIIKIDVEGYERDVLKGLQEMKTDYCWIETIKDRAGGISYEEAKLLVEEAFGRVSSSKQIGSNSIFAFSDKEK